MPQKYPVGKIRSTSDQINDVAVIFSVRIWYCGHNGFLSVHHSAVIYIPPISGDINTTIQNPDGELVLVILLRSGFLLEVYDGWWTSGVRPIFYDSPDTFTKWSGHLS